VSAINVLDEPSIGLHSRDTARLVHILEELRDLGNTVLVVEHDMEFVRQTAQRVTVLHEGSVLCEGSVDMVQRDPRVVEVYLGAPHAAA